MRVVFVGSSRIPDCGLSGTSSLWLHGLSEVVGTGFDKLVFLTHYSPCFKSLCDDPLTDFIRDLTRGCYCRPDKETKGPAQDLSVDCFRNWLKDADVLIIDFSANAILPSTACYMVEIARNAGIKVGIRIHSQCLQNLLPNLDVTWIGPCPWEELSSFDDGSPGGHIREIDPSRYRFLNHPAGIRPKKLPKLDSLVVGLGGRHRMDHGLVGDIVEKLGYKYEAIDIGHAPWMPIADITKKAARARAVVLWYNPIRGVGRSSALGLAVATGRPVITSNCSFLREGNAWTPDPIDLEESLKVVLGSGDVTPSFQQEEFYRSTKPETIAKRLLDLIA